MHAAKKSLATTGHNIANANTEGYSRQRVEQSTATPLGRGNVVVGSGVSVRSIRRVHDQLVEDRIKKSISEHQFNEERTFQLSRLEELYNETTTEGMTTLLNRFFNSFRELANNPSNQTVRSIVRENAKMVINDIRRVSNGLSELEDQIDLKFRVGVTDINATIENIAKLNIEIGRLETANGETGDLRDQRDTAIRTLSEFFDVTAYEGENGAFNVRVEGMGTVVAGGITQKLAVVPEAPPKGVDTSEVPRRYRIVFEQHPDSYLDQNLKKGKFAAMAQTKNNEIAGLKEHIDTIAFDLVNLVNAIHRRGFANKEVATDQNGNAVYSSSDKVTGLDFFKVPTVKERAAEYIDLSSEVKGDLANIATALAPNSPGDNRVALAIAKLQHEKVLGNKDATVEQFFHKAISKVGIEAGKAKFNREQSEGILTQAKTVKERISGVSIDEETSNMVRYQHAYDASAKVLKTANAMFDSVLRLMD